MRLKKKYVRPILFFTAVTILIIFLSPQNANNYCPKNPNRKWGKYYAANRSLTVIDFYEPKECQQKIKIITCP